jgi:hypothetical protein
MVVYLAGRVIHWLLTAATDPSVDPVSGAVLTKVAGPILTSAQFLIPAAVAISGIHKMMDHRESGGSFLVDMVTKGGVAGEVLDTVGRRAAIVDANLANPDAWGHLSLPETAATVRQVVVALTDGDDPPPPVHASTAALACYPEARETSEYSRTDIERFAAYLRAHFTFSVIDMSNRLPDPTGGPEASVAAYWLEQADALLLPTASSKQEFNGVLDYLDVQGLPPTVVAFLVPRSRRNREHPLTKRYLEAVTQRVCSVVPLPDESERVRYAVMEGIPAQDVSPSLKAAYRRLTAAIARAPAKLTA